MKPSDGASISKKTNFADISSGLEIAHQNISNTMDYWEIDYAIMFYAPWCKYCKQLYPSWEQIQSIIFKSHKSVIVGTFNCELDVKNTEFCSTLGVDRYPSIYYLGYGSFYQNHPSKVTKALPVSIRNRLVRYNANIYPEALYDWIQLLSTISQGQKRLDDASKALKSLIFGPTASRELVTYKEKTKLLQQKLDLQEKELEKYKADELFDSLEDNGDPFPLLSELKPDKQNYPFRVCVAEMISEFCKYHGEEGHCKLVDEHKCAALAMEPPACRPQKCPFSQRGCVVASLCLDTSVIKQYQKTLS